MADTIFAPTSNRLYTIARCQVLIQIYDALTYAPTAALRNLGDAQVTLDLKVETVDIKSNESSTHATVASPVVEVNSELKIKLRQFDALTSSLMFMSPIGQSLPAPVFDVPGTQTVTFNGVKVGDSFMLVDKSGFPLTGATLKTADDGSTTGPNGAAVPYAGYFRYDPSSAIFQVTGKPDTASGNLKLTFDPPAANPAGAPAIYNMLAAPEIYGAVIIRTNNRLGMQRALHFPLVRLAVEGSIALAQSGNEPTEVDFNGKILFDQRQQPGFERGFVRDLNVMSALGGY